MSFTSLGLSDSLLHAFSQFPEPTPVQTAAIPVVLAGDDLLATAQTGSGKTAAYVGPLLQRILAAKRTRPLAVHSLILVPTRELAAQVREVFQILAKDLPERIKVVSAVGGVSINPQMMALRGGADIIVATPGRLLDLVERNAADLSRIQALVLDEADRMLDLGFTEELTRIIKLLPAQRQNLLLSATFPERIESLAGDILNNPSRVDIPVVEEDKPAIHQRAIRVDTDKRTPLLRHLIKSEGLSPVLVFVAKQYTADHVADKLQRNGIDARPFHGDLSQGARSDVLAVFKERSFPVLVATDLAARGLDIIDLPVVINYDLPRSTTDYTHRIGRTGRAGKSGVAISFITAQTDAHFKLIEKRENYQVAREEIPGFEPTEQPVVPVGGGGIKGKRKSKKDKLREGRGK